MKAIIVTATGGPEVLTIQDRPVREPGPGELRVAVGAAGVNFIDTYHRSGVYPMELPFGIGQEGAGTVDAAGTGTGFAPGDRVAWAAAIGSYAEQVVVSAEHAVPVPDGVSDEQAAAVMLQGMTAHYLAVSTFPEPEVAVTSNVTAWLSCLACAVYV